MDKVLCSASRRFTEDFFIFYDERVIKVDLTYSELGNTSKFLC